MENSCAKSRSTLDQPQRASCHRQSPHANTGTMSPCSLDHLHHAPPNQVLFTSDAFPGRIYKLSLDGKLLGMFGQAGKQPGEFGWFTKSLPFRKRTLRS